MRHISAALASACIDFKLDAIIRTTVLYYIGRRSRVVMSDTQDASSVTLIIVALDKNWWRGTEPLLNIGAAAMQRSVFTHVEVALGEEYGPRGEMTNVLRIFNDDTGVVCDCT